MYISAEEAMDMLQVAQGTLYTYRNYYGFDAVQRNGRWFFNIKDIQDWKRSHSSESIFRREPLAPKANASIVSRAEWLKNPDTEIAQAIAEARADKCNPITLFSDAVHIRNIIGTPAEVEYLTPAQNPNIAR